MRLAKNKSVLARGVFTALGLSLGCLVATPAVADLQAGRDARGSLWLSDQGLPAGVKPISDGASDVMSLPQASTVPQVKPAFSTVAAGETTQRSKDKDKATCNGIEQRYEGDRATLEKTERDKASGKLLIPDSGLVSMRQNLATMDRLRALCQ